MTFLMQATANGNTYTFISRPLLSGDTYYAQSFFTNPFRAARTIYQNGVSGAIVAGAAAALGVCLDFTSYQICEVGPSTRSFSGKVRFQDET